MHSLLALLSNTCVLFSPFSPLPSFLPAASVAGIKTITDRMLYTAAVACADAMTPECYAEGRTFPKIQDIREGKQLAAHSVVSDGFDS
jgi:malic enzyme